MANVVGVAACPECGELQEVHFDTRKYYIKCTSCHTFTNYQSKAAQARIKNKIKDSEPPELPEALPPDIPEDKPLSTPARETQTEDDIVVDSYGDWY